MFGNFHDFYNQNLNFVILFCFFQGILLDGHCLILKLSNREVASDNIIARKGVNELEQGEATKVILVLVEFIYCLTYSLQEKMTIICLIFCVIQSTNLRR